MTNGNPQICLAIILGAELLEFVRYLHFDECGIDWHVLYIQEAPGCVERPGREQGNGKRRAKERV